MPHIPHHANGSNEWVFRCFSIFLTVVLVVTFSACSWNSSSDDDDAEAQETEEPSSISLTLNVRDSNGQALSGVSASSDTFTLENVETNAFSQLLVRIEESDASGTLRLVKQGYVDALVQLDAANVSQTKAVTLMARGDAIVFDTFGGGLLRGGNGTSVELPQEALQRPDGSPASGDASIYITPVDIQDPVAVNAFPGSFYGDADTEDEPVMLHSYGVVEIEILSNGEKLQLRDGQSAQLRLPLYATKDLDGTDLEVGDTIPFWILNETNGIWEQHGEGVVRAEPLAESGFVLEVSTTHFSWFNTDAWRPSGATSGSLSFCNLDIDIIGLERNEPYVVNFQRQIPGWPVSNIESALNYDGQSLLSRVIAGAAYRISARDEDGDEDSAVAACSSAGQIGLTLELGEPTEPPEFFDWTVTVEPVFTKDSNGFYEILENTVTYGGRFRWDEDDTVEVSGDIVTTGLNSLFASVPNGAYVTERYPNNYPNPTLITARLSNPNGNTEENFVVEFIEEQSPEVESLRVYNQSQGTTSFSWTADGVDSMTVVAISSTDPTEVGVPINFNGEVIDPDERFFETQVLAEYTGYLRVTFTNQYGDTDVYVYLDANQVCIPNSDIPCEPLPL